jgi:hypothetical protein
MKSSIGVILTVLGIILALLSFYFYDAAGDVVNPEDVIWGLGHYFRDIDESDIKLMQRIGVAGMVIGASLLLTGLALTIWRKD